MFWVKLTTDGIHHGFVFAQQVDESSTDVVIRGRAIAVPTWIEKEGEPGHLGIKPLPLADSRHPKDRVHVMAVKRPHRSWYPTPCPPLREAKGIPPEIRAQGIRAMAEYALATTALGRVLRLPKVRRVLAEESLLDSDGFFVPNFLENEDSWQKSWEHQRPQAFAAAQELTRTEDNCPVNGLPDEVVRYRRMVRMAAYRKLDVLQYGHEEPSLTPYVGLDAGFKRPIGNGLRLHVGRIRGFSFDQSANVPAVPAQFQDMALVESVEHVIHPGIPGPADDEAYWRAASIIANIRSEFAKFEEENLLPSIPARNLLLEAGAVPQGYAPNFSRDFFLENRLTPTDLARLHIPLYRSSVAQAYLDRVAPPEEECATLDLATSVLTHILAA